MIVNFCSLAEVAEESNNHSRHDRPEAHASASIQESENVTYTSPNRPMLDTSTIQMNFIPVLRVKQTSGLLVWLISFILILFGSWLGSCLIPYCIRDIQNTQHFCPHCQTCIGEYHPL